MASDLYKSDSLFGRFLCTVGWHKFEAAGVLTMAGFKTRCQRCGWLFHLTNSGDMVRLDPPEEPT